MCGWLSVASVRASRAKRDLRSGSAVKWAGKDLDRDVATELAVARAIHLAHAPGAERGHDRVGADLTIDHRRHTRPMRGDDAGRPLEEPRRPRLELEQRFHFLAQPVVSLARLCQERAACLRRPGQRAVVQVRDPIRTILAHVSLLSAQFRRPIQDDGERRSARWIDGHGDEKALAVTGHDVRLVIGDP